MIYYNVSMDVRQEFVPLLEDIAKLSKAENYRLVKTTKAVPQKPKKATKSVKKAKEPEFVKFDEAPIIKKIDDYQKSLPEKQQKAILQEIERLAYGSATIK